MKTSELTDDALDWAVAKAEGLEVASCENIRGCQLAMPHPDHGQTDYAPSSRWEQGGPIIERERIALELGGWWHAVIDKDRDGVWVGDGPTALIAAMRAFVASKLGEEIDL